MEGLTCLLQRSVDYEHKLCKFRAGSVLKVLAQVTQAHAAILVCFSLRDKTRAVKDSYIFRLAG